MAETALQDDLKRNQRIQRELRSALRQGTDYPRAKFFVWGEGLYYGMPKVRRPGMLSGNFIEVGAAPFGEEDAAMPVLRKIAKVLNAVPKMERELADLRERLSAYRD
jgi:hypothetical protein